MRYLSLYSKELKLQRKKINNLPFMYISTDPPEVNVITVTSHFRKNRLDCLARGVPTSYTYSRWEHKSMFGEHIRYLDGFGNGTLSPQNKSKTIKRFALFDLLKSLYSDTNILSKYIPSLQKKL